MAIKKPEPTLSIQKGEVYYNNSSIKYADENGNCYIIRSEQHCCKKRCPQTVKQSRQWLRPTIP